MSTVTYPAAVSLAILPLLAAFADGVMESRPFDELINRGGEPFFERWYLGRKIMIPAMLPGAPVFPGEGSLVRPSEIENIYLHHFLRADQEEPHDHPWGNATLVLSGWYTEDVYEAGAHIGSFRRHAGDVVIRSAGEVHAITGCAPGTTSLFVTLRKEREWAFHTEAGVIHHADFRAWKNAQAAAQCAA